MSVTATARLAAMKRCGGKLSRSIELAASNPTPAKNGQADRKPCLPLETRISRASEAAMRLRTLDRARERSAHHGSEHAQGFRRTLPVPQGLEANTERLGMPLPTP